MNTSRFWWLLALAAGIWLVSDFPKSVSLMLLAILIGLAGAALARKITESRRG